MRLSLSHISRTFGTNTVVNDVNLEIADSEFVVLVGPSGCGKSTTLRIIAGLEQPSSGTVWIGDRDVTSLAPRERNIALVFQNYALYPHMSVRRNLGFSLQQHRVPRDEIARRVGEVAATLQLTDLLDRKPSQLSGGQRQRVALGRAIVRDPEVFLFDEPLSNLDAKLRVVTRAELKSLHRRLRTTSVYVTHDQEEAMTLADRIVVMDGGVIQQIASPLEIYSRPSNRFVAGFLGMPPINFFEAALEDRQGRLCIVSDGIVVPLRADVAGRLDVGRERIVLGVRPEDVRVATQDTGEGSWFNAEVNVVEPLGSLMDVHVVTEGGQPITSRTLFSTDIVPEGKVKLSFDDDKLHFFEAKPNGRNLLYG